MQHTETTFQPYQIVEYPNTLIGVQYKDMDPTELVGLLSSAAEIALKRVVGTFYSTDALCTEMNRQLKIVAKDFAIGRYFEVTDFIFATEIEDSETAQVYVSAVSPKWQATSFGARSEIIPLGVYTKKLHIAR